MTHNFRVAVVSVAMPMSPKEVAVSFVFDEAYRLAKSGVQVHAIRLAESESADASFASYGMQFHGTGKRWRAIPFFLRRLWRTLPLPGFAISPIRLLDIYNYGLRIAEVVREHDLNIIHAHFAYPEGFAGLIAKRATKKPLIVTLHGYDILAEPTVGYGSRLDFRVNAIIKKVLREADAIVTASSATYSAASEAGCPSRKLFLIPNGVDIKRFSPYVNGSYVRDELGLGDKPVIFTLRGHKPQYGIEYLIKAAPLVLKEVPNAFFVIGGDGPLFNYHLSLARKLGISENIIFTGRISRSKVVHYYAACNIFVIPSLIEAFGLVTVEAMACGKPVIGTSVGGIPDIINDGLNGCLVKPRDSENLADKIILLLENPRLIKKMGKAGRKIAEENFSLERRMKRITELYDSLSSTQLRDVRNFWDERVEKWKEKAPVQINKGFIYNFLMTKAHKKILKQVFESTNPSKVLELGVGNGRLLSSIDKDVIKVGVDISINMLRMAKKKLRKECDVILADISHLPFRNESFDLVYTCTVLLHIPDLFIKHVVSEIKRVVKHQILLIEPKPNFPKPKVSYRQRGYCFPHDYLKIFGLPIKFKKELLRFNHDAFLFDKNA